MAVCNVCCAEKPSSEFYAHKNMTQGHMGLCKDCHKERMRVRSRTNPAVQEYDRSRSKQPHRVAQRKAINLRLREQSPAAYKAQTAVNNAVRDKRLSKLPCEFCANEKVVAHHRDYAKPLDVIWLCSKCHSRLHAMFPELEGANKQFAAQEAF